VWGLRRASEYLSVPTHRYLPNCGPARFKLRIRFQCHGGPGGVPNDAGVVPGAAPAPTVRLRRGLGTALVLRLRFRIVAPGPLGGVVQRPRPSPKDPSGTPHPRQDRAWGPANCSIPGRRNESPPRPIVGMDRTTRATRSPVADGPMSQYVRSTRARPAVTSRCFFSAAF